MVRGFRIKDGVLQAAKDNDAALDIDFGEDSQNWLDVIDEKTGNPIKVSVGDEETRLSGCKDHEEGCGGDEWGNVILDFESEKMKELAMYAGEERAYLYIDSTEGERLPLCGGGWYNTSSAGVFYVYLSYPRSYSVSYFGFRSAYFRKWKTED